MWFLLLSLISCLKFESLEVSNISSTENQCAYISASEITLNYRMIGGPFVTSTGDELYFCCPDEENGVPSCKQFDLNPRTNAKQRAATTTSNPDSQNSTTKYQVNNKIPGFKSCTSELSGSKERIIKMCCDRVGGEHTNGECVKK